MSHLQQCKFFPNCTNKFCTFYHPKLPCTFYQRGTCNKGDYCKFYHDKGESAVASTPVAPPAKTTPTGSAGVSQQNSETLPIFGQTSSELAGNITAQQTHMTPMPEILPPGITNAIVGPVPTMVVDETN